MSHNAPLGSVCIKSWLCAFWFDDMLRRRGLWQGSLLGSVCDLKPIETEHAGVNLTESFKWTSIAISNQFHWLFFLFGLFFLCFIHIRSSTSFSCFLGCNCNGLADECVFDAEQYRSTGSGGRCVGCRKNTAGPHCERCRENFFRSLPQQSCQNCKCNAMGELRIHSLQSHSFTLSLLSCFNPCNRF